MKKLSSSWEELISPSGITDDEWESILEEMINHLELMDEKMQ